MMKKTIFAIVCFFALAINVSAGTSEDTNSGYIINLESTNLEYDLGEIQRDSTTKETIKIINKLDEPLTVSEARSTCECIQVYVEPQIVEKGGIFEVEITLDTTGASQDLEEIVYIMTGNMNYELIRLTILAKLVDTK